MRQALHILRKDIRHLWVEIAVALLAAALLVAAGLRSSHPMPDADLSRGVIAQLIPYLLPMAWWTLIVRAVHSEPLTGDYEFWPTRPYSWKSLLAAKVLLAVLFVNLPLLIAQAVLVTGAHFSVASQLPGLLWTQLLIAVTFILPASALACITSGIAQYLLIVVGLVVGNLLLSLQFSRLAMLVVGAGWGPMDWWQSYYDMLLLAIAAVSIVVWQYATRRVWPARIFGAALLLIIAFGTPFSWTTAFAMQSKLSRRHIDETSLHASFFSDLKFTTRALVEKDGVSLQIPLTLTGVPDDMIAKSDGATFQLRAPNGAAWPTDGSASGTVSTTGQLLTLHDKLNGAVYEAIKGQPVQVRGFLYLTLYGNRRTSKIPFDGKIRPVPGMGLCSATGGNFAPYFLVCNTVFRPSPDLVSVTFEPKTYRAESYAPPRAPSYSPFPAWLTFNPVYTYESYSIYKGPLDGVTVVALEPLSHVRAPLAIDGLRLSDYEARLK